MTLSLRESITTPTSKAAGKNECDANVQHTNEALIVAFGEKIWSKICFQTFGRLLKIKYSTLNLKKQSHGQNLFTDEYDFETVKIELIKLQPL
jgi:hypothetical protein